MTTLAQRIAARYQTGQVDTDRKAADRTPGTGAHPLARFANQLGTQAPWWYGVNFSSIGSNLRTDPESLIGHGLLKKALEGGPPAQEINQCGNLVVPGSQLLKACEDVLHLKPVWIEGDTKTGLHLFASEHTMVRLSFSAQGNHASASTVTTSSKMAKHASQLFDRCLQPEDPSKGMVFTLAKSMHGYHISHLGLAGTPVERGNYSPNVLTAYDHVVEDLNSEAPCGRLVVLAGAPGTGKTYLIRSLLGSVPKAAFVLIPPHLVEELGSPEILPSLTAAKNELNGPIVMVIEDADQCLVPRQANQGKTGNMNAISSLLNLGDGILGSVLDIRIIATTNAAKIELDPATQRPGRLCKYAAVDALPAEVAAQALYRLTGKKVAFSEKATLAEVYLRARGLGWKPPPKDNPQQRVMRAEILG